VNRFLPALVAAFGLVASAATGQPTLPTKTPDVVDTSFVTADGARDLQQSVVIDAPVAVLWNAFVDPAQFERWNSPVAAIDLLVGGSLEASYDPKKAIGDPDNIKHRIITFLPNRLLVFQNIQAPRELPHADVFQRTVTVVQYEVLGPNRTRVTLSSTGWAGDPISAQLYGFFQKDNAEILEKMKQVFEAKP
jgi:uncharacterized protein YndB with AHSA1/START domain